MTVLEVDPTRTRNTPVSTGRAESSAAAVVRHPIDGSVQASQQPSKTWPMLALVILTAGLLVCGVVLLLQQGLLRSDQFQAIGAACLALAVAGLLTACWAWWCWQRDVTTLQELAATLYRIHAVMSQTNRLILMRPEPCELLAGVCEVCVNTGRLDLATVAMSDVAFGDSVVAAVDTRVVSSRPASQQLPPIDPGLQASMLALATLEGQTVVVDDASVDERLRAVRTWCVANGLCTLAAIPLKRGGALVGILLLGSRAVFSFAGQVKPLLSELGADVSFALDNADRERERHSALLADQARRMAEDANHAKTEFLAQVSHELRTPLNAMLGFAQLLASDTAQVLSATQAERVRHITHAGWHLLGLVNDVMDISRIESRRFKVANVAGDISAVLDEAVALTQPLARANRVELSEQAASKFGIGAVVDPRRLLQVLLNLLSNACKYNRPGGHVRVDVTRNGAEVLLDVVDDGVGMTQEHLLHLFEPFNRLGNEGHAIEGSGIGLTLTRQLVQLMNGRLEIESAPDSGTRARLVLPACAIPFKVPTEPDAARRLSGVERSAVVLYIEDDPVNQLLVEQMLLRRPCVRLLQAVNGEEGLAMARKCHPDLTLLDMQLPDMSGFDVLAALQADPRTESLRVVAVSANSVAQDIDRTLAMGALAYWTKPLELESFVAGISTLLSVPAEHEEPTRATCV